MTATIHDWPRNNPCWFRVSNLKDRDNVLVGSSAVVTMTIYRTGTTIEVEIPDITWPVTLAYVSDGIFELLLDNNSADISPSHLGEAIITIDGGLRTTEFVLQLKHDKRNK